MHDHHSAPATSHLPTTCSSSPKLFITCSSSSICALIISSSCSCARGSSLFFLFFLLVVGMVTWHPSFSLWLLPATAAATTLVPFSVCSQLCSTFVIDNAYTDATI